jgi:hypothetical protein
LPDIKFELALNKLSQTNGGTNLSLATTLMSVDPTTGVPRALSHYTPNNISFDTSGCNSGIQPDLGLGITNVNTLGAVFLTSQSAANLVTFVTALVQPVIGKFICNRLEVLAVNSTGGHGLVQQLLDTLDSEIGNLAGRPEPVLATEEATVINALTPAQQANIVNFRSSKLVTVGSSIINGWLSPGLVINQVMDLLTMPFNGTANFINLVEFGLERVLYLPPVVLQLKVQNVTLTGVDTFTQFKVLADSGYNHTLNHVIGLGNAGAKLVFDLTLAGNAGDYGPTLYDPLTFQPYRKIGWVLPSSLPAQNSTMRVTYQVGVQNLIANLSTLIAIAPSDLKTLQVGQLVGKTAGAFTPAGQIAAGLKCASRALYNFSLPNLRLQIGGLPTPNFTMVPNDVGLSNLVNSATKTVLDIVNAAIVYDLKDISEFWLRPVANNLVWNNLVSAVCLPYVSQGPIYPNFLTGVIFDTAVQLIGNVVGGNPVSGGAASINALIPLVVNLTLQTLDITGTQTGPGAWSFTPDVRLFPGYSFNPGSQTSIGLVGLSLGGVNSIYKLTLAKSTTPSTFDFGLAIGQSTNQLVVSLATHWIVQYDPLVFPPATRSNIDETFSLNIQLYGIDLELHADILYNLDQLYQLQVSQLTHVPCVFMPIVSALLQPLLTVAHVGIAVSHTSNPGNVAGNPLTLALAALQTEAITPGYPNLGVMVTYILKSVVSKLAGGVQGYGGTIGASNCSLHASFADSVIVRVLQVLLVSNFTELVEKGTGPQPAVPAPALLDLTLGIPSNAPQYDLSTSSIFSLVPSFIKVMSTAGYQSAIKALTNSTTMLHLETDGSVTLNVNFTKFAFSGIPLDLLITGARLHFEQVILTHIDQVDFDTMHVIEPVSKFVLNTHISVPGVKSFFAKIRVDYPNALKTPGGVGNSSEHFTLNATLDSLLIDLQVLMGIVPSRVAALSLGSFITVDDNYKFGLSPNMLQCLFSIFYDLNGVSGLSIPLLQLQLSSLTNVVFNSMENHLMSAATEQVINAAIQIVLDMYVANLKDVSQGALRSLVSDFFLAPNVARANALNCPINAVPDGDLLWDLSSSVAWFSNFTRTTLAGTAKDYGTVNALVELLIGVGFLLLPSPPRLTLSACTSPRKSISTPSLWASPECRLCTSTRRWACSRCTSAICRSAAWAPWAA